MADNVKQLTLNVTTQHQAAVKGLVAIGGSLQQLSQKAVSAQASLKGINAFVDLKRDTVAAEAAWKGATNEVARLARELKNTENPTQTQVREFDRAKKSAAKLKDEYQQNSIRLNVLRKSLQQTGVNTSQLTAEQGKLKKSFQQLRGESVQLTKLNMARGILDVRPHREVQQEIKKLNAAYARMKAAHEKGTISARELYNAELQLNRKTAELKASTNGWTESITKARGGLFAMASAGYAVMKSFQGYAEYEQRIAEVGTIADASVERMSQLSDEISRMSTEIPQTADSLAAAEYDIISAGVALENSTAVLERSAKAAVAGVTDTKTAVNAGLGVVNAYGLEINQLGSVYDVLFQTVKRGVTTFPELSQSIGDTLPTAKAADVDYRNIGAAIATLTQAGIKTPQAATALKGAINSMAAPAPEAKKKFDELGITWQGLIPTLEQIAKKNLSIDQMRLLIPDTEARTGVLALTQNLDKLKASEDAMVNSAGSMQDAYDKMKDTPENQLIKLQNSLSQLGREAGEFVSVFLLPTAEGLREVLHLFNELPSPVKAFVATLTLAGGGLVLWRTGLKDIVLGLKGMKVHMLESAAASTQMSNTVVASSGRMTTSLNSVAGAASAMSVVSIAAYGALAAAAYKTWQVYQDMRDAQDEAAAAAERLAQSEARNQGIVKYANEVTGLQIENIRELNQLLRDGAIVIDEQTGEYQTLAQAQEKHAELTARQEELDRRREESMQQLIERNKELEKQYGKFDLEAYAAAADQEILNAAWGDSLPTISNLTKAVKKTSEAYLDAAEAAKRMTEGEEGYEKAQKKKLAARRDYVQSVKALNDQLWKDAEQTYREKEQALENSYERRKLQLEKQLQNEIISRDDYAYQVTKAEAEMQEQILQLRKQAVEKSAEIYGKDTEQYKAAVQEKIDAELDLERDKLEQLETLNDMAEGGGKSNNRGKSRASNSRLPNDQQDNRKEASPKAPNTNYAGGFYGQWDSVGNTIKGITSLDALRAWKDKNSGALGARGQLSSSAFTRALNKHARDLYNQRLSELQKEQKAKLEANLQAQISDLTSKTEKKETTKTKETKQMTLRFQSSSGQAVSGTFNESDAAKMVEILRQAGMITV